RPDRLVVLGQWLSRPRRLPRFDVSALLGVLDHQLQVLAAPPAIAVELVGTTQPVTDAEGRHLARRQRPEPDRPMDDSKTDFYR
ncbi:MAG TPA: hypothetical protein VK982_16400, partial [Bacteroidales bacterium]|nr:hypothetical protein [Bacteroidales bacterium]